MKKKLAAGFIMAMLMITSTGAFAAPVLDQSWESGPGSFAVWGGDNYLYGAQTLTAGMSGYLTSVELLLYRKGSPGDAIVEIRDNFPGGSHLGTSIVAEQDTPSPYPAWVAFGFSNPIYLDAGQTIAITLASPIGSHDPPEESNEYYWKADYWGDYQNGLAWRAGPAYWGYPEEWTPQGEGNWDLTFRTYMDTTIVPEPISSILFLVGGATLGFRRFRRKRS